MFKQAAVGTGVGICAGVNSVLFGTYLTLGFENFMIKLCDDPALVERMMDIYLEFSIEAAEALVEEGIDMFYLNDDIAMHGGFIVSPRVIEGMWYPRTERILEPVRKKDLPILMHCCGNLTQVIPLALKLGVHAIHPFEPYSNDIYAVKRECGDRLTLFGNMDIAGVLTFGTPDEVTADTREHVERLGAGGRYVCGSSHSIIDAVPPENFLAMIEACHTYGVYD
jgi:uroporphyrinogen decarboxylase